MSYPLLNPRLNSELKNKTKSFSQAGMSLVEIMVGVFILAIIGAGMATMMVNSNKEAASVTARTDFNSLVNTLQGVFNNTSSCIAAFGGNPGPPVVPSTQTIPAGGGPASVNLAGSTIAATQTYGKNLKIIGLDFSARTSTGATDQYVAPLVLTVDRLVGGQANAVGGSRTTHTFSMIITLESGTNKIKGCAGLYTDYWTKTGSGTADIAYGGGKVGIGPRFNVSGVGATPTDFLEVDGNIQAVKFLYASDSRLKENIREIPSALDRALKLHGVIYDWKNRENQSNATNQLGLIAQEVEAIFPEAVSTNPQTGMKAVAYGNLIAPMIEALKEQQDIIQKQQQEIAEIKKILLKK